MIGENVAKMNRGYIINLKEKILNISDSGLFKYAMATLIPAIINVLSMMIFTRIFLPSEYGLYSLVITTTNIVTIILSQWIVQSIQRYRHAYTVENKKEEFNNYLIYMMQVITIGTLLSAVILNVFLVGFRIMEDYLMYWLSVVIIISQSIYSILITLYQADLRPQMYRNYQILNNVLKFSFIMLLIIFVMRDIRILLIGTIISNIILISMMICNSNLKFSLRFSSIDKKAFMQFVLQFTRYGMPMLGWFLGTSILQMIDRYMLQVYRSSVEVGIYSANSTLVTMSLGLICAPVLLTLHPIIMSKAAKSDKDELARLITRGSQIFLLIVTPITIYITLYRYDIVGILLGEAYRIGADIVPVTMVGYFLWNIAMFGHKGHEIHKKTKSMLVYVLIAASFNVVINLILIPLYGYMGAAYATSVSLTIYPILIYFTSKKYIPWKFPIKTLFRVGIISVINIVIAILFTNIFEIFIPRILSIVLGFIVYILTYVFLLIKTKEIDSELIDFFKKIKM
ncbi:hypothetical protein CN487_27665 [Bacillus cereus]|nr:hypothetical protein CN487_27665 [Bacillus cereus]